MLAVVQRVAEATVTVGDDIVGSIGRGLCILVGVERTDDLAAAHSLAGKVARLRIFPQESPSDDPSREGRMQLAVAGVGGEALVVSQFTLAADLSGGNRPSFADAAPAEVAEPLVEAFVSALRSASGVRVATGRFGASMRVRLVNDGPVTLILRTDDRRR